MNIGMFFQGIVIGFLIAAPVGPIGILCIRRTLGEGRACGLLSGLGAATADAVYACVAAFGVTFISDFLVNQSGWFRAAGGVFLCYVGLRPLLTKAGRQTSPLKGTGLVTAYASTFFLTLTNPMTILAFAAMFAGSGFATSAPRDGSAGILVIGVFAGSALWWVALSAGIGVLRDKLNLRSVQWINRISGAFIIAFGLLTLFRAW